MTKNLLIVLVTSLFLFIGLYLYIFHKPHRDFTSEPSTYSLTAQDLLLDFQSDELESNKKYLNTVLQINGVVSLIQDGSAVINESVFCSFETHIEMREGQKVIIKGRCTGYDDLFSQVTLERCIVIYKE